MHRQKIRYGVLETGATLPPSQKLKWSVCLESRTRTIQGVLRLNRKRDLQLIREA